jgi:hypothetical protein
MRASLLSLPLLLVACTKPVEPAAAEATVAVAAPAEEPHGCGGHELAGADTVASLPPEAGLKAGDEATCVVMNRKFLLTAETPVSMYDGKAYAFCCDGCKEMFDKDPAKYAQLALR